MKKALCLILSACILIPFCLTSCSKKENASSDYVSEAPFVDSSSGIAKTEEDGKFTFAFDPYVLPDGVKKSLENISYYKNFVDAVIEADETVSMPSREYYDKIRFAIGENFAFSALISNLRYDSENNQILISYEYNQSHDTKIKDFEDAVSDIFDECVKNSDGEVIAAMSIYTWLAQNIEIVENVKVKPLEKPEFSASDIASSEDASSENTSSSDEKTEEIDTDILNTLLDKKGTETSVAALYNFLLRQLDIECMLVSNWNGNEYNAWNMVELDSKWYHCIIPAEIEKTEGTGLKFFGMTKARVVSVVGESDIYTGQADWLSKNIPSAKSERFNEFSTIASFEITETRNGITAFTDEFGRFSWSIND